MRNLDQIMSVLVKGGPNPIQLTGGRLAAAHDHAGDEDGGEEDERPDDEGHEGEEDRPAEGAEHEEPVRPR